MQNIKFSSELMQLVENGTKIATTRLGVKSKYHLGSVAMIDAANPGIVLCGFEITKIETRTYNGLDKKLALEEGYEFLSEFCDKLREIYKGDKNADNFKKDEIFTVIHWKLRSDPGTLGQAEIIKCSHVWTINKDNPLVAVCSLCGLIPKYNTLLG